MKPLFYFSVRVRRIKDVPRNVKKSMPRKSAFCKCHGERLIYHIAATGKEDAAAQALAYFKYWDGSAWVCFAEVLEVTQTSRGRLTYWD